jgi:hypothetical protein
MSSFAKSFSALVAAVAAHRLVVLIPSMALAAANQALQRRHRLRDCSDYPSAWLLEHTDRVLNA